MFGNKETKDKDRNREKDRMMDTTSEPSSQSANSSSVIGEHVSMNGTLRVEGSITIHGEVEGSITCSGALIVGKTGRVKADLDVGSAVIGGCVEGKIQAEGRVELETNSHLTGDVHAKSFVIQDGCFFQGNCTMGEANVSASPQTAVPEPSGPKMEVA